MTKLETGLPDRGDRGQSHAGSLHIVKSNHRYIFRNPNAVLLRGIDCCCGKDVGAGKEGVRSLLRVQSLRDGRVGQSVVDGRYRDIPLGMNRKPGAFQCFQVSLPAVPRILIFQAAVDKAYIFTACGDQIIYRFIGGGNVVDADVGAFIIVRIFTAHCHGTISADQVEKIGGRGGREPQNSLKAALFYQIGEMDMVQVNVLRRDQKHFKIVLMGGLLDPVDNARVKRIGEIRYKGEDRLVGGDGFYLIGIVAELIHGLQYLVPGGERNRVLAVEDAGDGGDGDAGLVCDIRDRDFCTHIIFLAFYISYLYQTTVISIPCTDKNVKKNVKCKNRM